MSAAADGTLAAKSNNPFSAPGTDTAGTAPEPTQGSVDEGDIEAEGVESSLVSLERVTAVLTLNAAEGISPGMKVKIYLSKPAAVHLHPTCNTSFVMRLQQRVWTLRHLRTRYRHIQRC